MPLDRAAIIGMAKPRIVTIFVPEWGGDVCLREITAGQRDQWDAWQIENEGAARYANIRARLLVLTICDEQGARLFGDKDIDIVSSMPAQTIDRLWDASCKLVGLRPEDVEKTSQAPAQAGAISARWSSRYDGRRDRRADE